MMMQNDTLNRTCDMTATVTPKAHRFGLPRPHQYPALWATIPAISHLASYLTAPSAGISTAPFSSPCGIPFSGSRVLAPSYRRWLPLLLEQTMIFFRTLKRTSLWQIVGLVLLLNLIYCGCAAQPDTSAAPSKHPSITVNYVPDAIGHLVIGQALVQVMLNGTTPATFLVDTGSAVSVISQSLAKKLDLALVPAVDDRGRSVLYNSATEQSKMATLPKISIGGLTFNNRLMLVAEQKAFMLRYGLSYDGVIGMSLLRYEAVLLDARRHTLTFYYPGALEPSMLTKLEFTTPYTMPLVDDEGIPWVQARFSNHGVTGQERLRVDIGANETRISERLVKQLALKTVSQQKESTLFGDDTVDAVRVEEMQLGDLTLWDHPVTTIAKVMLTKTVAASPLLGLDVLSGYRVLMDFPAGKLYLQPYPGTIPAITIGPAPATAAPPAK